MPLVAEADARLDELAGHVSGAKLGPIARYARLGRVNRTLHRGDQTCKLFLNLRLSDVIEIRMSEGLLARESLRRVHFEEADHEL